MVPTGTTTARRRRGLRLSVARGVYRPSGGSRSNRAREIGRLGGFANKRPQLIADARSQNWRETQPGDSLSRDREGSAPITETSREGTRPDVTSKLVSGPVATRATLAFRRGSLT